MQENFGEPDGGSYRKKLRDLCSLRMVLSELLFALFAPLRFCRHSKGTGAGDRIRTRDPLITNQLLYQLSYAGTITHII